eukprot:jgi/Botrbrau1/4711/Bobra.0218s0031.1
MAGPASVTHGQTSSLKMVYHYIVSHALTLVMIPVSMRAMKYFRGKLESGELEGMWEFAKKTTLEVNLVTVGALGVAFLALGLLYLRSRTRPVYLVDYFVFRAPDRLMTSYPKFKESIRQLPEYSDESRTFMDKIIEQSGVGEQTYMPEALHKPPPWKTGMNECREEAEMVMFTSVRRVLEQTGLKPKQIDVLIVNCSIFNPTPSLSAMIVNHFKMRSNVVTYNLGGMGCSAGIIAISLARELLQVYPNANVLVMSTENITHNLYLGNQRSMLIPGCIFRIGGAAMILSSKTTDKFRAKYKLTHLVRTHNGADDEAYQCVYQCEDKDGIVGVRLSKELMKVAGRTLKQNITELGPKVLPLSEILLFAGNMILRKLGSQVKPYVPDFKLAFDHFCMHTGGRAVIDAIEEQLALTPELAQPSKEALRRYGNVSSSSIWYVLAWIEHHRGVKKGDKVWQIGFGSGFKVNSAVWVALRNVRTQHEAYLPCAASES